MKLRMARNVVILGLRIIRVGKATNGLTSARIRAVTNVTIGVSKATNFLAGTRHRVNVPAADVIIDGVLLHGNLARGIGRRRVRRRPEYFRIISGRCMRRKARD